MVRHRLLVSLALMTLGAAGPAAAGDWPQWCGTPSKNMISTETGLPETFVPGDKDGDTGRIKLPTAQHVLWGRKIGNTVYSTPTVAHGRIFLGGMQDRQGFFVCLDERTGDTLWRWSAPAREVPSKIDGRKFWFGTFGPMLGVCSTGAVDGDCVYFMSHRLEVLCLDVHGTPHPPSTPSTPSPTSATNPTTNTTQPAPPNTPKELWKFDLWEHGVRPSDACNGSAVIDGDFLYICTCNGVDRDADAAKHDELRQPPAPNAPSIVVLDKHTGRLLAEDDFKIGPRLLHGSWSSVAIGTVAGKKLAVFGGGDGTCYAAEALATAPDHPVKLKTVWSCDCVPPEYRSYGGLDPIAHYSRSDRRRHDTLNKANDGTLAGQSEIIGTPVICHDRVYVAMGKDPEHGRARGALHCLDATQTGDITATGKIWSYQAMDVTLSTAAIADGLVYIADESGRVHCLDAATGKPCWVHKTEGVIWSSTLVADGRIYLGTPKGLLVMAAGREERLLSLINLGAPMPASPVAANGVLYVAAKSGWLWAVKK